MCTWIGWFKEQAHCRHRMIPYSFYATHTSHGVSCLFAIATVAADAGAATAVVLAFRREMMRMFASLSVYHRCRAACFCDKCARAEDKQYIFVAQDAQYRRRIVCVARRVPLFASKHIVADVFRSLPTAHISPCSYALYSPLHVNRSQRQTKIHKYRK